MFKHVVSLKNLIRNNFVKFQTCCTLRLNQYFICISFDTIRAYTRVQMYIRGEIKNKRDFHRSSAQPHRRGLLIK